MAKSLKLSIDDHGEKSKMEGTGCVILFVGHGKDGELDQLSASLHGKVTDEELLMMLSFALDKLPNTFDDEGLTRQDIIQLLENFKNEMLASERQGFVSDSTDTLQ